MTKDIGTVTVTNGVASIQLDTSQLEEGTYNIITRYNQNDEYQESSTNTELNINSPKTNTAISIEAPLIEGTTNHAQVGGTLTVTATITTEDNQTINEGQVIFKDNLGNTLETINVNNNTAIFQTKYETTGSKKIIGIYNNATNFNDSSSTASFKVGKADIIITPIPVTVNVGDRIHLKAEVRRATDNELINEGKGLFRTSGATIRDDNGNAIYPLVVNGIIELKPEDTPAVTVLEKWKDNPMDIKLVISTTSNYNSASLTNTSDNWLIIN